MKTRITLLIVEESDEIRSLLRSLLAVEPEFHVIAEARDAFEARQLLVAHRPDVMLLDVALPRMDGVKFLEKVMKHFPVRTLVLGNSTGKTSQLMMDAIAAGAIDTFEKPTLNGKHFKTTAQNLASKVRSTAAAAIRVQPIPHSAAPEPQLKHFATKLIAIASSTGGTEALKHVLPKIKVEDSAILIVQHLPETFVGTYVEHLSRLCRYPVKEAEEGEKLLAGTAYMAPGDFHMEVRQAGGQYAIVLHQQPLLNSIRPSADYLMHSIARLRSVQAVGIVLTGMGKDGAAGLLAMRKKGSFNIAQDESTSIVYGMPKEAEKQGAIDKTVMLDSIAEEVNSYFRKKKAA